MWFLRLRPPPSSGLTGGLTDTDTAPQSTQRSTKLAHISIPPISPEQVCVFIYIYIYIRARLCLCACGFVQHGVQRGRPAAAVLKTAEEDCEKMWGRVGQITIGISSSGAASKTHVRAHTHTDTHTETKFNCTEEDGASRIQ